MVALAGKQRELALAPAIEAVHLRLACVLPDSALRLGRQPGDLAQCREPADLRERIRRCR